MSWMQPLADAAVVVTSIESGCVVLRHADRTRSFQLHQRARALRPSEIVSPPNDAALLVAPSLTASAEARLRKLGWSWATDAGQLHLRFDDHAVDSAVLSTTPRGELRRPDLPTRGTGTFAVLRRLLLRARWRQVELATATGLTQARVSQVLNVLSEADLVTRAADGWSVTDWDRALEVWLSSYPGPRGVTTYWSGLDDVWTNTLTALGGLPAGAVLSGDVAADLVAPWRQPRSATIYVPAMDNLARTGLVPVTTPSDETVAVCVPDDRSVWPLEPIERTFRDHALYVSDPLQILVDVAREEDADSDVAAERLVDWIKNKYAGGAGRG